MQIRSIFYTNIRSGKAAAPPGSHCLPSVLGGCAGLAPTYPLRRAGEARPLALPMGELARRSRD